MRTRADGSLAIWKQSFNKGYVEQAFTRSVVSEVLLHGPENAPYMQRRDGCRKCVGRSSVKVETKGDRPLPPTVLACVSAPTVHQF